MNLPINQLQKSAFKKLPSNLIYRTTEILPMAGGQQQEKETKAVTTPHTVSEEPKKESDEEVVAKAYKSMLERKARELTEKASSSSRTASGDGVQINAETNIVCHCCNGK